MARRRATGRFYVFLLLLGVGAFLVARELFPSNPGVAIVMQATTPITAEVEAVVVRDEEVVSYEGSGRVVYVAAEGAQVQKGEVVAEMYTASFSEKAMQSLETTRQNIRVYHQSLLDNIIEPELERLEENVQRCALELKTLVSRKTDGNLINLEKQLEDAMVARQNYFNQNSRQDAKLMKLYDDESKAANTVENWKQNGVAPRGGVVSFYLDGCELFLTPDNLSKITADDVRVILSGRTPQTEENAKLKQNVFRIVSPDKWYVILLSDDAGWNPMNGQTYTFQLEGYEDLAYTGTVIRSQKEGKTVMTQLEVDQAMGPLINRRYGKGSVGTNLAGISVPVSAIATQNGQTGVLVNDVPGGTFVPVSVLKADGKNAIVQPLVDGSLNMGQQVLLS